MTIAPKIFAKYKYDIALEDGAGANLVTWVTGLMVFFVTLALSVHFALATVTDDWVSGLSGSLTVEIKSPQPAPSGKISAEEQKSFDASVEKILWLSKQHPAVISGHALTQKEIKSLIEPWLGSQASAELALPAIIDIKLAEKADIAKLQADIQQLVPNAVIDSHSDTLDDVQTLVNTARMFVLLLTSVIGVLAVMAISGIVHSKFLLHQQEVETLHLIGASDHYIAKQFRSHTLRGTLRGALGGVGAMFLTLIVIGFVTHSIESALFPQLSIAPMQWVFLAIFPIVAGSLIAHFTAQRTVMNALARLP